MSGAQVSQPDKDAGAQTIEEIDSLWLTAGLNCDGDTRVMTGAPSPASQGGGRYSARSHRSLNRGMIIALLHLECTVFSLRESLLSRRIPGRTPIRPRRLEYVSSCST
jgi:hypothetical protein